MSTRREFIALPLRPVPRQRLQPRRRPRPFQSSSIVGFDPVADGLVASFSRPGGNATGVFLVTSLVGQKRLEILRELNPKASTVALLVNPVSPDLARLENREIQEF